MSDLIKCNYCGRMRTIGYPCECVTEGHNNAPLKTEDECAMSRVKKELK